MGKGSGNQRERAAMALSGRTPAEGLILRDGKLCFQRIGNLNMVKQRYLMFGRPGNRNADLPKRNPRAPERYGIWAFPYPLLDRYFAGQQYEAALPKRFKRDAFDTLYEQLEQMEERGEITQSELRKRIDGLHNDKDAWLRTPHAAAHLRPKTFWVEGQIYTHLKSSTNPQGGEWRAMGVGEFAQQARASLIYQHGSRQPNVDHLEVFIPRSAGIS